MMCDTCKYAGEVLSKDFYFEEYLKGVHALCEYPETCTCQHMTTTQGEAKWINCARATRP